VLQCLITFCRVSQLWYTADRLVSCATVSHNFLSSHPALGYNREASQLAYGLS